MIWTLGILAGGSSSRMGRDKALLSFKGKPLLQHVLDRLGGNALISAQDNRYASFGTIVPDLVPGAGPLAGIQALLTASPTDRLVVCGCDMPFASRALVDHLMGFDGDLILPVSRDGDQPLHAVYSRNCLPAIATRLREGRRATRDLQKSVVTVRVPVELADWLVEGQSPFLNVNTPEDVRNLLGPSSI